MIAVVIPARDEELTIESSVRHALTAGADPALQGEEVVVIVVGDRCRDRTAERARHAGALVVRTGAGSAGASRHLGARTALCLGARWLCFTDADSHVEPGWIAAHLACQARMVCGTVSVRDWGHRDRSLAARHADGYRDVDGHRHVHGANLGIDATLYQTLGGFPPLRTGEDVALVDAALAHGVAVAWSAAPRVTTSARRQARAPGGFAHFLNCLEDTVRRTHDASPPLTLATPAPQVP
jgi:glycosyltransferase involved in cell wall biosynthesis